MQVNCWVHIFSGSFDMRVIANEPNEPARLVHG